MYPILINGLCEESLYLQKEYLDLIGWVPKNENLVKSFELLLDLSQYYQGGNAELLERNPENDQKINDTIQKLEALEINPYISQLSRL
jgi:hypothetical protein